jgi:hypothetical protein
MRQKSEAIEFFLKEMQAELCDMSQVSQQSQDPKEQNEPVGVPQSIAESCEPCKGFSFSELKKNARIIVMLTASNLTSMYKSQGRNVIVDDAKFIEFSLGGSELIGQFKMSYLDGENRFESMAFVAWNGTKLRIF